MLREVWVENKTSQDVCVHSQVPGSYPGGWVTIPAGGRALIWVFDPFAI